ncbi:MAG: sulfite exporter TauE/SafE family protein [Dehalococcoidales bacterium]|nr:sulfite exporter TauE/SafE family protein [Dehalococcoidales bacterium]
MELGHLLILMGTGAVAGFAGGMLGLGGAFIMTPVQFIVYTDIGLSDDLAILTSFGTSLLVVLPTAISGAFRHHRNKAVMWKAAFIIGAVSSLVALGGATLAANLPGTALKTAFGIVLLLAGIRMVTAREPKYKIEAVSQPWLWMVWAIPVGLVAGLFGVGGGVVMIPILVLALRFEMHFAVGTSLAVMILTSVGGTIGYIVNGLGVEGRLDFSLGYVNLTSWLLLAVPSAVMVQAGAVVAHRIPRKPLMYIFIAILLFMSLRMLGVFELLGWSV